MNKFQMKDFNQDFPNDDSCLEWLRNKLFPNGIACSVCKKVTKHHKVSKRRCYACDNCGNQVYPTSGTIFHRSTTPLKTWFKVINKMSRAKHKIPIREIQRENCLTYNTACRLVKKVEEFLNENGSIPVEINKVDEGNMLVLKKDNTDMGARENKNITTNSNSHIWTDILQHHNREKHNFYPKRDRTARLLKLQILLNQNPQGLSITEIAEKCSISKRTTYRDLRALEFELDVPIWEDGTNRGITEGFFLPPVNFTLPEAINIFIVSRNIQNTERMYNPSVVALFTKLNSIVPIPLRNKIQYNLEYVEKRPLLEKRRIENTNRLMRAWLSQHKVKIVYKYRDEDKPMERIIEPRYFEPSLTGGFYVIAFCHLKKAVCAFKMRHIVGEVSVQPDTYIIPDDFNAEKLLDEAWGLHFENEIVTVKLRFKPDNRSVIETRLHPSQIIEAQEDGSFIMTLKVRDSIHFRNWIMGWGDSVEVLEPKSLRNQIREIIKSLQNIYR